LCDARHAVVGDILMHQKSVPVDGGAIVLEVVFDVDDDGISPARFDKRSGEGVVEHHH